jgi:hypothetical protein
MDWIHLALDRDQCRALMNTGGGGGGGGEKRTFGPKV